MIQKLESFQINCLTIDKGRVAEKLQCTRARSRVFPESVVENGGHIFSHL